MKKLNSFCVVGLFTAVSFAQTGELKSLEFDQMNLEIDPKTDFYEYSCGKWRTQNPIPESESRWSSFDELSDKNNNVLNTILERSQEKPGEKGSATQLIGDYSYTFSDTVGRNKNGIAPIRKEYNSILAIKSTEDLIKVVTANQNVGIGSFWGMYVSQDAKINTKYAVYLGQGGMGLSNRDYYFKKDERSEMIRMEYQKHMEKMLLISGFSSEKEVKKEVEVIFGIEKALASGSMSPVERRDIEKQYNKMTTGELGGYCSKVNWNSYFEQRGAINLDTVIVGQPLFMQKVDSLLAHADLAHLKLYLKWQLLDETASTLSMDLDRQNFAFYSGVLRGTKKQKEMWKRAIESVSHSAISEALGEAFVEQNFSPEAKEKVNEMVANITLVFEDRIKNLDWMSADTKVKALEKLGTFVRKLGFPDEWKDYSALVISRESYAQNVKNSNAFEIADNMAKLNKPIDKSEWGMAPHIINAYYNPLLNEIVFPAGIMQAPFFSEHYEDAVNYARMGAVIGHELTHGFDDMGSQFDAVGRMNNWWTAEDKAKFDERTQKLIDQYSSFEVLEGVFVDGKLTLGENIADLGGLTIAYHAYKKSLENTACESINGFTCSQRFFIAFGQVWKNNIRNEALIMRVQNDPHSPGKYRVNGTLSNMPEFFEAFEIKEGDAMRQSAEKIATIW